MQISKIKPIPKYMLKRIQKEDMKYLHYKQGTLRFYAYLTKNAGELVKVTVAVKYKKGNWHCKQVAVHGVHSKICFVKDIVFHMLGGYSVGWYEQGLQKYPKWYEDTRWRRRGSGCGGVRRVRRRSLMRARRFGGSRAGRGFPARPRSVIGG